MVLRARRTWTWSAVCPSHHNHHHHHNHHNHHHHPLRGARTTSPVPPCSSPQNPDFAPRSKKEAPGPPRHPYHRDHPYYNSRLLWHEIPTTSGARRCQRRWLGSIRYAHQLLPLDAFQRLNTVPRQRSQLQANPILLRSIALGGVNDYSREKQRREGSKISVRFFLASARRVSFLQQQRSPPPTRRDAPPRVSLPSSPPLSRATSLVALASPMHVCRPYHAEEPR